MTIKRILIIDDNALLTQIFEVILKKSGYETRSVNDGTLALETVISYSPQIIILDIMMEPLTGWDVLVQIREKKEFEDIPILMVTGKALHFEDIIRFGEMIDGYILKPLTGEDFTRIIREYTDLFESRYQQIEEMRSAGKDINTINRYFRVIREKNSLLTLFEEMNKRYGSDMDYDNLEIIEKMHDKITMMIDEKNLIISNLQEDLAI